MRSQYAKENSKNEESSDWMESLSNVSSLSLLFTLDYRIDSHRFLRSQIPAQHLLPRLHNPRQNIAKRTPNGNAPNLQNHV